MQRIAASFKSGGGTHQNTIGSGTQGTKICEGLNVWTLFNMQTEEYLWYFGCFYGQFLLANLEFF